MTACIIAVIFYGSLMAQQPVGDIARQMVPGWNLGNTFEAVEVSTNTGGQTTWHQPVTTRALIDYVAQLGFRSIRIPCSWVTAHRKDGHIDRQWMAEVRQTVDWCLDAGLYVLLNDHWDGGWLERSFSHTNDSIVDRNIATLQSIWTEIATEFRDYDADRLLFAGANEPDVQTAEQCAVLMRYHQAFVDAVRATGGNNRQRVLVVQGPSTDIDKTHRWMQGLPIDPTPHRLMVEIHYYTPYQFADMREDADWGRMFFYWGEGNHVAGSTRNSTWGEEAFAREQMQKMRRQFTSRGVPVIMGEYAAKLRTMPEGESQECHEASAARYFEVVTRYAVEAGIVPMVWDTGELIDRTHLRLNNRFAYDAIIKGISQ